MSLGWTLFIAILTAIASLVVILEYFGIRPTPHAWKDIMSLSQRWKFAIMLVLIAASFGFSGYAFYRSRRPIVVEKIVEKSVDKLVPQKCPAPTTSKQQRPPIEHKKDVASHAATNMPSQAANGNDNGQVGQLTQGSGSIAQVGGNGNIATIDRPYDTKIMYSYDGSQRRTISQGGTKDVLTVETPYAYNRMAVMVNKRDWDGLILFCQGQRKIDPTWATLFVFEANANVHLGNIDKADSALTHAIAIVGDDQEYKPKIDAVRNALAQRKAELSGPN
jgi:hypothetical protein